MTRRILLTEDDNDVRALVSVVLEEAGYVVDQADTVAAALSRLAHGAYDLLLTDGRLPDGNGFMVAEQAEPLGIKVLVYTGYAEDFRPDQLARYTVLRKPLRMDELVRAVARIVES